MQKKKNLFILESSIGYHHNINDKFDADILSFTFIPLVSGLVKEGESYLEDFSILLPKNISPIKLNSNIIKLDNLLEFIQSKDYELIFIGMDLDIMGNGMSRILLDTLLKIKDNSHIIRIPLTSIGFSFVSDFWDNDMMNWFLNYSKEEMEYVQFSKKALGSFGVGRRTPLILHSLLNAPQEIENINTDGTSSITYLVKKRLKEV